MILYESAHLVIQAELQLGVHGGDFHWENLPGLLSSKQTAHFNADLLLNLISTFLEIVLCSASS